MATSASASWRHSVAEQRLAASVVFPQGGSTLTQQLVRGYFLRHLTGAGGRRARSSATASWPWRRPRCSACPPPTSSRARSRRSASPSGSSTRWSGATAPSERAKEEILARYASFIYMGNGRYGFSAASEYYFAKPLSSYGPGDADKAALLAGITKSPARLRAPRAATWSAPRRRRNDILGLMARNGIAARRHGAPCPGRTRPPRRAQQDQDGGARRRRERLHRAQGGAPRGRERGSAHRRPHQRPDDGGQPDPAPRQRGPGVGPRATTRRAIRRSRGLVQGSVVVLRNADAAVLAEAGGRQVYKDRYTSYSDYNRVTDSRRQPGSVMKPIVYLAALPPRGGPRRPRRRRAHLGLHGPEHARRSGSRTTTRSSRA